MKEWDFCWTVFTLRDISLVHPAVISVISVSDACLSTELPATG